MNRVALLSDNFFVLEELTVPRITEYEGNITKYARKKGAHNDDYVERITTYWRTCIECLFLI